LADDPGYHWLVTTEEIVAAALKLDHQERARLVGRLLRSLNEQEKLSPAEFGALWLEETERRMQEWEQGKVEGIPGNKVMKEFRHLLAPRL
jgi:putative addiction module component (TIGR02574 family)